jgi:hypothetical protein
MIAASGRHIALQILTHDGFREIVASGRCAMRLFEQRTHAQPRGTRRNFQELAFQGDANVDPQDLPTEETHLESLGVGRARFAQ